MRNQMSGAFSLDTSSLAEDVAEHLDPSFVALHESLKVITEALRKVTPSDPSALPQPAGILGEQLTRHEASEVLSRLIGSTYRGDTLAGLLQQYGYVLVKLPDPSSTPSSPGEAPSWFDRTSD